MLNRYLAFCFDAKLKYIGKDDTYIVPFQIIANNQYEARAQLWEYLNHPELTGYRYEECVGLIPKPIEWVYADDKVGVDVNEDL